MVFVFQYCLAPEGVVVFTTEIDVRSMRTSSIRATTSFYRNPALIQAADRITAFFSLGVLRSPQRLARCNNTAAIFRSSQPETLY